uniref:M-phase phosphoprotein 9 n=1 Tax=Pseudonaja textilis TaxID=8673 RepID=A0A670ZQY9_PSETE
PCLCAKQASSVRLSDGCPLLGSPMGLKAEAFEENELFTSQFHPGHADHRAEASTMHQEGLTNSVSISSGYGTLSTVDLSPSKCDDLPSCMENSETMTKRPNHPAPAPEDVVVASVQDKRECSQTTIGHLPPLKENDGHVPTRFERQVHEGQPEEPNGKPLTSWAQKMKQNHLKKINVEEKMELEKEQTTDICISLFKMIPWLSATLKSVSGCLFYPTGLTYWKLDEKEMYQALPKNLGNEFSTFSTKDCSEQLSSSDELKLTSLKDIYHKKQKEDKQLEEWNFSPVHSTHPPEILTLDPTLHMKPSELNAGRPLPGFYPSPEGPPFSPDSMAGPAFSLPSEANTFSHTTSTVVSPRSTESPRYASRPAALHRDPWGGCEFQNATSVPSSPHRNREILDMEDDNDNLTLTPSSDNQYPIPLANNCLAQHELSVACVEDPQVLSRIRQNLREKHIRHITDLRAYYESEILSLKQQLEASHTAPSEEMKKIHQNLTDRCNQLETSLHEANGRVRSLENKNKALEMEVADWRERFSALSATTKSLQERLEETRMNGKEKDNTISRLKRRLRDLEEAFEKAYKLSDNKDARLKEENRMFQNVSWGDSLNITENKLLDAHTQISDLKRCLTTDSYILCSDSSRFPASLCPFSKLESFDVSRRKWLIPGSEFSIFTGQPLASSLPLLISETAVRCPVVGFAEVSLGASRSPEKSKEQPRHKKFNSSSTQRSSSLPPSNRKTNTPTKRETMLTPMAVTYSPKRSPKENLSPGFSHYLSRNEDTMTRFDIHLNEVAAAPAVQYGSPRKRLQFCSGGDPQGKFHTGSKSSSYPQPLHSRPSRDSSREGYEEGRSTNTSETSVLASLPHHLSLEDRLERINRELGSIRMTLKRFQVLRTSTNI